MTNKASRSNNAHLNHNLDGVPTSELAGAITTKLNGATKEYIMPSTTVKALHKAINDFDNGAKALKALFQNIAQQCHDSGMTKKSAGKLVAQALGANTITNAFPDDAEKSNRVQAMWQYYAKKVWGASPKPERTPTITLEVDANTDMNEVCKKLVGAYTIAQLKLLRAALSAIE